MRGTMLWFNELKDYGLISTEDGERLSVHGSGFAGGTPPKGRCAGLAVSFQVVEQGGARTGAEVVLVQEIEGGRARLRHGGGRSRL
jgi:cold shock CspA family protein